MTTTGPTVLDDLVRDIAVAVAERADLDPAALDIDLPFDELELDSLVLVELAVQIEGRYGILVPADHLAVAGSVRGAAQVVVDRLGDVAP